MAVRAGQDLELAIEKAASGGRMIARHEGEIVLVQGAIPGERVIARITRAEKRVAFADTLRIIDASADRRAAGDPACGGCLYAHITPARQQILKQDIVRDAFIRIGKIPLDATPPIATSTEEGYRMRARFHVRDGRPGFYRDGTHELCSPATTGQLRTDSIEAVEAVVASLSAQGVEVTSLELSENVAADQRAVHLDLRVAPPSGALARAVADGGLTGCTARSVDTKLYSAGDPVVTDPLTTVTRGRASAGTLQRHPEAFFQANRFLLGDLVTAVLDAVPQDGTVLDLYAGVGLFSVALAAAGRAGIVAVEGDPISGRDLQRNAASFPEQLRVSRNSVEAYLAGRPAKRDTVIVDPPRTGMSKEAVDAVAQSGAARIVYVSCDAPTMARDARKLLDSGYRLQALSAFDLFPNTPHVETLGVFER